MFYPSRLYDEQEPLFKDLNQCVGYRKTIEFFIKTKGLDSYSEQNSSSLEKVVVNADLSVNEKKDLGRDYTLSKLERLMSEFKVLEYK